MRDNNLKESTLKGLTWKLLENFSIQFLNFIIQIVLARILMPEDYGIIVLTGVFITIANVFVQTGFSSALIQKENVTDIEYSSVFFAGLFVSLIIYCILFIGATSIAEFYSEPVLIWVLRVQSLSILFSALSSVQNAILIKNLQFKKSFKYRLLGISSQGFVGISLAVLGYGVWALVSANIVNAIVIMVTMWFVVDWKPKIIFSFVKLKSLFSFSSKILLISLLECIFNNIRYLIIGRVFNSETLGYFNRGYQIPTLIMVNTDGAINTVMFPVLSTCQNDKQRFISIYRRSIRTSIFITFPLMFGLIAIAEPLTILLLTEKWLPSVPFLYIACLTCVTWPFFLMYQAFNALGKSGISLKLNIISVIINIILILASIQYGVYALAISSFISSLISLVIGAFVIEKILEYKILQQIKDVLPSLMLSLATMGIVIMIGTVTDNIVCQLFIQIITGVLVYMGGAKIFKMETFDYLFKALIELIKKSKKQ